MKKYCLLFMVLVSSLITTKSYSQLTDVLITLQYKAAPDSFYVYMTPSFTRAPFPTGASTVTLVFQSVFTISAPASTSFQVTSVNGGTWAAQDYVQEPGVPNNKYVTFINGSGAAIPNVTAGQKTLLFRFRLTAGGNCVGLLRNYANNVDPEDPSGTASFSFLTYINEAVIGDHFSTNSSLALQSCLQLTLPVHILDFNARREGNDGVINWSAIGEEFNSDYYELERSVDGTSFRSISKIDCRKLTGVQKYEYVDQNIASLNSKYVYYRVKQYDFDDKFAVSGIRQLKMDITEKGVQMYPNPVKSGFYLNIPFTNPSQSKVSLTIMNGNGQAVHAKEITTQQATNYYYDLRGVQLAVGDYYLKIIQDGRVVDIKKFLISKE